MISIMFFIGRRDQFFCRKTRRVILFIYGGMIQFDLRIFFR